VKPSQLRAVARGADALVYVAGLVGTVAGGLLYNRGELPFALLAWAFTFVACTVLLLAAWALRALAELLQRTDRIERTLDILRDDRPREDPGVTRERERAGDPRRPWGGWH